MTERELFKQALSARSFSYSPYSNFCVGAALLCKSGMVYTGCNIENAAFSPTNCAERTAFFKAVSEGERDFEAIAVAGGIRDGKISEKVAPCGVCRQVMAEFCQGSFKIILGTEAGDISVYTLSELLKCGFGPGNLKK